MLFLIRRVRVNYRASFFKLDQRSMLSILRHTFLVKRAKKRHRSNLQVNNTGHSSVDRPRGAVQVRPDYKPDEIIPRPIAGSIASQLGNCSYEHATRPARLRLTTM